MTAIDTRSVIFVTCSFVPRQYPDDMKLQSPSRLFATLRHLLVLCAVVSLLAPQTAHAGMSMDRDVSVAETTMDAHSNHINVAETTQMDHGSGDACAGMICFYAMPFAMTQGAVRSTVIRVGNVLPPEVAPGSISPAMLSKPPKYA